MKKPSNMLCASNAAIRLTMTDSAPSSSSSPHLGSRAIDRHNPIITDERRALKPLHNPQPPLTPRPQKNPKTTKKAKPKLDDYKRKSVSDLSEQNNGGGGGGSGGVSASSSIMMTRKSWSCKNPGEFISPPSSTRYLLSSNSSAALLNVLTDFEPLLKPPVSVELMPESDDDDHKVMGRDAFSVPPVTTRAPDQVVVLRVSLHCRGCERKMRKHISKMDGVKSFNIDFAAKRLTVVGDVTPLSVLASVSKVKNAQLLNPTVSTSSLLPMDPASNYSRVEKYQEIVA